MAVTYVLGSEENAPSFVSVDKTVRIGLSSYRKVEKTRNIGWSNNRVEKTIRVGLSSCLKTEKSVRIGQSSYDMETLQILGQI